MSVDLLQIELATWNELNQRLADAEAKLRKLKLRIGVSINASVIARKAMSIASARAAHTKTFLDTCTIADVNDYTGTLNTTTGELDADTSTVVYSGACSFRSFVGDTLDVIVGGQQVSRVRYRLTLPWAGTEGVQPGQTVTATSSPDSALVGRTFIVQQVKTGAWEPSRRCDVEDRVDAARQQ